MSRQLRTDKSERDGEIATRRRTAPWLLGGLVLFLLFLIVAQQALGVWSIVPPDTASDTLLLYALSSLNFAAFIVFAFIFVRSLLKLRRERRERQLGSKIKTRLVIYFIALSLLPITAMATFSYLFLNRSLEKWFYRLPNEIVEEALEVQRGDSDNQRRGLAESASMLALLINERPDSDNERLLSGLVSAGQLAAVEIVSAEGAVLTRSDAAVSEADRSRLARALRSAPAEGDAVEHLGYFIARGDLSGGRKLVVARARRTDTNLSETITGSQGEYQKLRDKQKKVRLLGLSTLGLLTLLLLFASTWIAIHLARGIATPIKALAEAADEVARGNLAHRVTSIADDELALLAESFNQMTAQLAENRRLLEAGAAALRDKNLALEERRNYIETVLESLATGVISLDENDFVTTINAAAAAMLHLPDKAPAYSSLSEITSPEDRVVLERLLRRARRAGRAAEQTELARGATAAAPDGAAIPVALTATALRAASGEVRGVVLVIEDLSELLTAQRAAAWSEVARRMAHEIKNPLTPIQLSAERIAKNFRRGAHVSGNGGNGSDENADGERERIGRVVDECTATITREVSGLKAMVDEFSRFARLPHAQLENADLNEVVMQAVALYEDRLDGVRMDVHLARTLPPAMLDAEQLRRVFVNLIDNALEAVSAVEEERRITLATALDPSRALLLIEVADTGHGIARADSARLFQPYFSTRARGTGLGLAIVQRIIFDHGGRIRAEANRPRGAKFVIELPATNV